MVVTTKQTKVLEPPAPSRSNSSTATPKAAKRASLNPRPATSVPTHSVKETTTDPNDTHGPPQPRNSLTVPTSGPFAEDARIIVSPKKSSSPRKSGKGKPAKASNRSKAKRMSQIIDLLTKIVFLLFSIYSLLVCPKDVQLESPVCRGLDYYRRTIVDPYILPPLRAAVTHPAVAPHIEKARPYVETTVETVKTRYQLVHDRAVVTAAPYVLQAKKEYNSRLRPHVRLMEYNIRRYRRQAEPYVQLFKVKSLQAWHRVEPHVLPVLLKIQQVPTLIQTFVAKPLEQGKEKWVDPQMKKIVDKVHEMSANAAGDKSVSLDEAILSAATAQQGGTFATTDVPTYYSSPSDAPPASITRRMRPTIIQTATAPSTNPPVEETPTETVVLAPEETVQTDGNAPPVDGTTDPLDQPLYNPNYDEDVEDIDFWFELDKWLSESVLPEGTGTVPASNAARPSPTRLTAQQKAEKKAKDKEETARKRKELTTKHAKWEKDMEALITKKQKELVTLLGKSRKAAVKELKALKLLGPLKLQLPNALKTTKPWLVKMKANWEDNFGELDDGFIDKISRWSQILEDVEWGFVRKKEALDAELSKWVIKTIEEESKAIKAASEEVKEFSKKAQSNLIEDYAMLWDVTYRDWENYHRFMFRGDEVGDQFHRMLNGDAASGAPNPVNDELNRLQQEISTITQEFKSEVDKIRKEGLKYILGDAMGDGTETDAQGDAEMPEEKADPTAWDPEISILPIDDSGEHVLEGADILIGKGKEQVQQAFEMAEEAAAQEKQKATTHEEL
ncbi:hypothetical protein CPB86DRAFT_169764 [Serendipita vermifera]|nr:hypothetical protein CPB86DRAFT_169764 [Serendipita vermifera]